MKYIFMYIFVRFRSIERQIHKPFHEFQTSILFNNNKKQQKKIKKILGTTLFVEIIRKNTESVS